MTQQPQLIPNHIYRDGFDPAESIRLHPVQLRFEFFRFFARVEHKGVVHQPSPQLFAFPEGISHFHKYSNLLLFL